MSVTLMLHCGAAEVDYDALRALETPDATASHVPIPHFRLVELVRGTLSMFGHVVAEEHHAITEGGDSYFGLMTLKSPYTGYTDTLGLRNSNDRAFPVGIGFGARTFVCSNLSFVSDHVIKRRHTANLKRDLPGIVGELIEPLALAREAQAKTFNRYRQTMLTDHQADATIMRLYREGVINVQRIADVAHEWDEPSFEDFKVDRSVWRLFNAATFALTGRVMENPNATPKLHTVLDGVCSEIH
jgi:hypothetical protein